MILSVLSKVSFRVECGSFSCSALLLSLGSCSLTRACTKVEDYWTLALPRGTRGIFFFFFLVFNPNLFYLLKAFELKIFQTIWILGIRSRKGTSTWFLKRRVHFCFWTYVTRGEDLFQPPVYQSRFLYFWHVDQIQNSEGKMGISVIRMSSLPFLGVLLIAVVASDMIDRCLRSTSTYYMNIVLLEDNTYEWSMPLVKAAVEQAILEDKQENDEHGMDRLLLYWKTTTFALNKMFLNKYYNT